MEAEEAKIANKETRLTFNSATNWNN